MIVLITGSDNRMGMAIAAPILAVHLSQNIAIVDNFNPKAQAEKLQQYAQTIELKRLQCTEPEYMPHYRPTKHKCNRHRKPRKSKLQRIARRINRN